MKIASLHLTPEARKKMEATCKNTACLAVDEVSQAAAPLLHAASLRFSFGREIIHKLKLEHYLEASQTFGAIFCVILLGDFLQLPPVPEALSLLHPILHTTYEQQQAKVLLKSFQHVYQFTGAKRFTDPHLIEILSSMRNGTPISDNAWAALRNTLLKPGDLDSRKQVVSLAQQLRPQASAHASGQLLYYIQAIDKPLRRCTAQEHAELLRTASMSETNKLMGMLPIHLGLRVRLTRKISAPQLVQEREGTVVGIELRQSDLRCKGLMQQCAKEHGHWVCKELPLAIYVKIDDFTEELLPPVPCEHHHDCAERHCMKCKFFPGIVAIKPSSAKWEACLKKEKLSVHRLQFALAPALVKTIHSMQGSTAEPGLIGHWNLPSRLGPVAAWLTRYVLLSRVRSLSALFSVGLPTRQELETGPPEDLRERINNLFADKISATCEAAKEARRFLAWPERT